MRSHIQASTGFIFLGVILLSALGGCAGSTLDFTIQFDAVHGLKKGDPIYFEAVAIGTVDEVEYTDAGDFLVSVAIGKEFASAATDASKFYIDFHPQNRNQKAIQVVQVVKDGTPIDAGAVIEGHTKYAVLYEQFAHELGQNLSMVEYGINEFFRALQDFSDSEQLREIEKQLDDIIADLGDMTREMKYRLEHEMLPRLREKIEELRKNLEGKGQDEKLQSLDRKMERIDEELRI